MVGNPSSRRLMECLIFRKVNGHLRQADLDSACCQRVFQRRQVPVLAAFINFSDFNRLLGIGLSIFFDGNARGVGGG